MGVVCYRVVCLDRLSTHESLNRITMDRLCFMRWVLWSILSNVVELFDKRSGMSDHWTWSIYPQKSVDHLVQNYGCIMRYAERVNRVWIIDLVR